ncbi:hypothetical protein BU16DRAFT_336435 [Lophium mytilinum]|uniref:Uncharacterized protein n=1 Tax=Lophium mytilinum TaxID=390894 RepID=A0A6A6QVY4_9PEZI|nr:hypothetical protein BU16DRAFT_336435 [Lophium mytilinum]
MIETFCLEAAAILALGSGSSSSNTSPRSRVVSECDVRVQNAVSLSSEVVLGPDSPPKTSTSPLRHKHMAHLHFPRRTVSSGPAQSGSLPTAAHRRPSLAAPGIASFQARLALWTPPRSSRASRTCGLPFPCMRHATSAARFNPLKKILLNI